MNTLPEWLTPDRIILAVLLLFLLVPVLVLVMPVPANIYEQMAGNRRKSIALCAFFILLIIALGFLIGELTPEIRIFILPLAVIMSVIGPAVSYYSSDKIILRMSKARPATHDEDLYLKNTVEGLSIAAGVPPPKIYVIEDSAPNAFATGRNPQNGVIAVTTGLLEKLDRRELEGVLAHEMSHIKNYDTLLSSLAVILVGTVVLLSDWMLRSMRYGHRYRRGASGRSRRSGGQGQLLIVAIALVLAIAAPLAAQLLRLAVSRKRELLADANGAFLTRYPEGLLNALKKLYEDPEPLEVANKSTAHLYIINPLREHGGFLNSFFSTHPPIEERIAALKRM